jgi:hypothetical protein
MIIHRGRSMGMRKSQFPTVFKDFALLDSNMKEICLKFCRVFSGLCMYCTPMFGCFMALLSEIDAVKVKLLIFFRDFSQTLMLSKTIFAIG